MPNPKLETYKNKATGVVYDYTDADAQSKIPSTASSSNKLATASDVASRVDWESYAKTGAYNLCNPTADSSGIVTKNGDGTYTVNGTLAAATVFEIGRDALPILKVGMQYKIVGCPSTKPTGTYLCIRARSSSDISSSDTGNGVIWDVTNATKADAFMFIYLAAGTYDNVVFKPMVTLRLDATYADYAQYSGMTNRELTEKVQGIINAATNAADFAAFKTAIGNL